MGGSVFAYTMTIHHYGRLCLASRAAEQDGANWSVHHSKHPHLSPWRSALMTLGICTCNLKEIQVHSFDTLGLWRNSDSSIWTTFPGPPNIRGASRFSRRQLQCPWSTDNIVLQWPWWLRPLLLHHWLDTCAPTVHQNKPLLHVKLWLLKESPFVYALGLSAGSYWTPPSNNIMFVPLLLFMLLFEFTLNIISSLQVHCCSTGGTIRLRREQALSLHPCDLIECGTK